jgi:predicted Zn-dependent protease
MERYERELRLSPALVRDDQLNGYVREVACRVSGEYCGDLRVYLIEQPYFNATMAPNGMMAVWTGSLLRMRDESELAYVLGHEFAHFRQRHTLQAWRKAKRTSAFLSTFGILTYGAGAGAAGMMAGLAGAASLMSFSREAEREADALGFMTAVEQGYDPQAAVRLWQRLLDEENARRYGKPFPVFASHPRTAERLQDIRTAAAGSATGSHEPGRSRFRAAVRPFLTRWLEAELGRRMYDTSIQVIDDLRSDADDEDRAVYTFYLGEAYRQRGAGDDLQHAARLYAEAISLPSPPAAAWREHGLASRGNGQAAQALAALRKYLELTADGAEDRAFIEQYLRELESRQ